MPVKLVDEFDFFGSIVVPSSRLDFFVGDAEVAVKSWLVFETPMPAVPR